MRAQDKNVFVGDRILELAGVLDDAYGGNRKAHDMGGYILYFPDAQTYEDTVVDIWEFYNIEPTLYEYMEYIGESESSGWKSCSFFLLTTALCWYIRRNHASRRQGRDEGRKIQGRTVTVHDKRYQRGSAA